LNHYLSHVIELRTRMIRCGLLTLVIFLGLFYIDNRLYSFIAKPLLAQLPSGSTLIATTVTASFTVPMKLAFIVAIFFSIPYILFQLWSFIAPGLYPPEKQKTLYYAISSLGLFYSGTLFAYFVICPVALAFFAKCAPSGVVVMTDIQAYLDFVLTLLFAGGVAFQVPIITFVAIRSGIISEEKLTHFRPYIIVTAFILGMLLTPPDVVSQILLALPMWGLFEVGLFCARKKI